VARSTASVSKIAPESALGNCSSRHPERFCAGLFNCNVDFTDTHEQRRIHRQYTMLSMFFFKHRTQRWGAAFWTHFREFQQQSRDIHPVPAAPVSAASSGSGWSGCHHQSLWPLWPLWLKKEHPGSAGASPSRGCFWRREGDGPRGKGRTFRGAKRDDGTRPTGRGGSLPFPDGAGKLLLPQADCFTNKTYHDCTSHERLRHQVTARSAQRFPG